VAVRIHDLNAFRGLAPADVVAYLRANGWRDAGGTPGVASVWRHPDSGGEVFVPLDPSYADFTERLADVVKTAAAADHRRDEPAVLEDMQTAGVDVVRVRVRQSDAADGTVALVDRAVPLYAGVPDLMAAAACAANDPRSRYGTSRPVPVNEFVRRLRLGQSERGSYVLKVLSPVEPRLGTADALFEADEPFARRAVLALGRAVRAARAAADEAAVTSRFDPFERAVADGVSANLCEALVKIGGGAGRDGEMAFSWTWAATRPADASAPREASIPADRLPLLAEAARQFRASAPQEAVEVRGLVVRLQKETSDGPPAGPVTVHGLVDGVLRKVVVTLPETEHRAATDAYNRSATVVCTGDLVRNGSLYTLQNPRGFAILADE